MDSRCVLTEDGEDHISAERGNADRVMLKKKLPCPLQTELLSAGTLYGSLREKVSSLQLIKHGGSISTKNISKWREKQSGNLIIHNRVRAVGIINFLRTASCDVYVHSEERNVNYNIV